MQFLLLAAFMAFFSCGDDTKAPARDYRETVFKNDMLLVPAGFFWRGSENGEVDEQPVKKLWLDSFYIDRFPITNAQYAQYLENTKAKQPLYWNDESCNGPAQPAVGVSWKDALAYCKWRSEKDSCTYTLPTEAQWEKAARGEDKRIYPWGNQLPDDKRAPTKITEAMPSVGQCELGHSPYGVADMVGNVWNWCSDWYSKEYYRSAPGRNPDGPVQGRRKVVRGGNWVFLGCCSGTPAYALRTTRRNSFHPHLRKKSIGFRCVKLLAAPVDTSGDAVDKIPEDRVQ